MKKYGVSALLAAGLLAGGLSTSATAADFGGDCCADLEERIAELEATTARKGNRKVSLTVSGWVAEQVLFWDDGEESNVYVQGIGTTLSSHFKFTGSAQINSEWSAGYVMQLEADTADTLFADQDSDDSIGDVVNLLQSFWFLKSKRLGQVSVGLQSQASDNTAILVDGSGSLVPANWVVFDNVSFFTLQNGVRNGLRWADYMHCHSVAAGIGGDCNGVPTNSVRYDSPTWNGFSMSASWGEDDFWDVAVRYAGAIRDFNVAVAAAYNHNTEGLLSGDKTVDAGYFQIGAYAIHNPTGLFFYGAYGHEEIDNTYADPLGDGAGGEVNPFDTSTNHFYLKGGLRRKLTPIGHSVFYGEFAKHYDQASPGLVDSLNDTLTGTEVTRWGLGYVQEIDAAAMSVWFSYRNIEAEYDLTDGTTVDVDELQLFKIGALIAF